jgi:methylthioribose-1-phosphate isomerase
MHLRTLEWVSAKPESLVPGRVRMIDQTRLPTELVYLETADVREVWKAIRTLQVRGAPAIGIAGAMGVVAAVQNSGATHGADLVREVKSAADYLATSRPTAANLFWALDRMKAVAERESNRPAAELKRALAEEAVRIRDEDAAMCREIGQHGITLLAGAEAVLTHCNAGGLATAEYGTALSPVYVAQEQGRKIRVYADETRPLLQGSRLTAWELMKAGVDVTLICDNTAADVLREGRVQAVLVGADRIAANGDTANKVGTYGLALLARAHRSRFMCWRRQARSI